MMKNMLSLVVRKGAHAQTHTQSYWKFFQKLMGTAQLGSSLGAFTIKTELNLDLECVEKSPRERKVLINRLKQTKTNFTYLWLNKPESNQTPTVFGKNCSISGFTKTTLLSNCKM